MVNFDGLLLECEKDVFRSLLLVDILVSIVEEKRGENFMREDSEDL